MTEVIRQAILAIMKENERPVILSGRAVNVTEDTFDLEMDGKPDVYGVRIGAIASGMENYMKIIPAEGSYVLAGMIENTETEAVLLAVSEVDKITGKVNGAEFTIKDGKFTLKNDMADCKQILSDLLSQLQSAIIQTPAGPGSFSPADIGVFTQLAQQVNQLFE